MPSTESPDMASSSALANLPIARRPGAAFAWLRMTTVAGALAACSSPLPLQSPKAPDASVRGSEQSADKPVAMKPPAAVSNWADYRQQAAQRLIAANPGSTYLGEVPETLLAIPVLEIEVNVDGSVKHIHVLRYPKQAKDTTQLAIDAVHRAAPFGNVARLPRPWKFAETFLFNDARQFKPRTLD